MQESKQLCGISKGTLYKCIAKIDWKSVCLMYLIIFFTFKNVLLELFLRLCSSKTQDTVTYNKNDADCSKRITAQWHQKRMYFLEIIRSNLDQTDRKLVPILITLCYSPLMSNQWIIVNDENPSQWFIGYKELKRQTRFFD